MGDNYNKYTWLKYVYTCFVLAIVCILSSALQFWTESNTKTRRLQNRENQHKMHEIPCIYYVCTSFLKLYVMRNIPASTYTQFAK
jgi:heme exporter protein D